MKCDKCKYLNIEFAGSGWPPDPPYSELWCGKGHWSGWIEDDQPEVDPWADCKDFEQKPALKPQFCANDVQNETRQNKTSA